MTGGATGDIECKKWARILVFGNKWTGQVMFFRFTSLNESYLLHS